MSAEMIGTLLFVTMGIMVGLFITRFLDPKEQRIALVVSLVAFVLLFLVGPARRLFLS